ncbi:MAG: ABC transporter ATP-binding protein [Treponema sp.]|nr:ABC transporter ATP-binding protein [Treponema sp.]
MSETAVCFQDFSFTYRTQTEPSLRNVNLTVKKGEKVLVLGPSGSGKSTLAHCINGLIPHAFSGKTSGFLSLFGENAENLDIFTRAKKVGTVLQDTDAQFVGLSAAEDIAFAAENDCVPVDEMRVRVLETANLVNIEKHLAKAPQNLSGGQKQRVSMSGVLMDSVELLLFDEPLANLDPATGKKAIKLIDDLKKKNGKTIIIIEHRLEDAISCPVDRIIVMEKGRVIADMPPDDLLSSSILVQTGIREPLYLSALRYVGIKVTPETHPSNVDTLVFDPKPLIAWNESLPLNPPKQSRPALLEIKNLCFRYDNSLVLDKVSFTVERGASVALAGRNGAGKSTLAKLICGFDTPSSGAIFFDGKDLASLSIKECAERIGFCMQNPNLMLSFPLIFDEVAFGLRNRGISEGEVKERVYETLNICGLYPFRSWPISALSFGQKKRLTIAAILVFGPSLLIIDEPTAGQDFRNYSRIMEFLRRLNNEQHITLLMITHDMHLMLEYAEKAVVLSEGVLIADAPPALVLISDAITEKANLKRTSLDTLARRAGLEPKSFIEKFIAFERDSHNGGVHR